MDDGCCLVMEDAENIEDFADKMCDWEDLTGAERKMITELVDWIKELNMKEFALIALAAKKSDKE